MFVLLCATWVWLSFTTVQMHIDAAGVYATQAECDAAEGKKENAQPDGPGTYPARKQYYCIETPKPDRWLG